MPTPRLIMYHKQSTSARTRFLMLAYGGVCGFDALPAQAVIEEAGPESAKVVTHPASVVREAETRLGLPNGSLEAEPGFRCKVAAGDGRTEVFLARFTSIDPPDADSKTMSSTPSLFKSPATAEAVSNVDAKPVEDVPACTAYPFKPPRAWTMMSLDVYFFLKNVGNFFLIF